MEPGKDLKFTTRVLTIKSQTLSKTFPKSLFARVVSSGFKFTSGKANTINFAKFENSKKSNKKIRIYSDITGMLPGKRDVGNTIKLTFLENSYITSTLPRYNHLPKLNYDCKFGKSSETNNQVFSHIGVGNYGKNGVQEAVDTFRRVNSKIHMRRKTMCRIPVSNLCAEQGDCTDDEEIQEIFEQASKQKQVGFLFVADVFWL